MRQRPKYKYTCPKRGHRPMDGVPTQPTIMNGGLYFGRVCRECLVVFFEFQGEASELLGPDGGGIVAG